MPISQFKITPTPPTSIKVEPGQDGKLSFTVENLAAPDKVLDVEVQALIVGEDGKGKEADWLAVGPKQVLSMSGGETQTITITARPKPTSPRGEHKIKLVVAEKDRPNDVYAESQTVTCEVLAPAVDKQAPHRRRWWLIPVIAGGLVVAVGVGLFVRWWIHRNPPEAVASGAPLAGRIPLTVTFKNSSTGKVTHVEWRFGDGSPVSELDNPSHTYQTPGTYTAELTVKDKRGRTSTEQLVVKAEVPLPPQAAASGAPLSGPAPLTVRFQNKSTGNPSKLEWRFGDGSPASEESNPSHTFRTPGTYTVTLTAKDKYGGATTSPPLTVKAEQPSAPVAMGSAEPPSGPIPLTVRFQNKSLGNPSRAEWNFGDGSPVTKENNPSHVYAKPGAYTATLTVWDSYGASSAAQLAVKADPPPPPKAVAFGEPLSGRIPLTVRFQSRSTGNPSKVEWSFGDGSSISEASNPSHVYARAGTYTVTLTARDSYGGSTSTQLTVRAEAPAPVASFRTSVREGKWPLEVAFTDTSQHAITGTQWAWRFGDGVTSSERSPRHRFEEPKDYTVHLRVWNANGASETESVIRVLSRKGELHPQRIGPFGGPFGNWEGQFQRCPGQTLAYGFSDKVEPSQGGGDDTALNGIKLWCVNLPDLQSNNYITSKSGPWGDWSERMDCKDRKSYIVGARLRIEPQQGGGDDTGGVDVELWCSNSPPALSNGGHGWGAWRDWQYCPANTAICGIKTRVEPSQGGGDDTALNDAMFQCCYVK